MFEICADENIYRLFDFKPNNCELKIYDPDDGLPACSASANAMIIRTVTKIDNQMVLELPSTLKFIGTASAGINHVDVQALADKNIKFAHAKGCNARAVAEYVATGLLMWMDENGISGKDIRVGIVGAGHVGRQVIETMQALDITYCLYDPPRAEREPDFRSVSLQEVLDCNVLTFHTPLTVGGRHATHHWLNKEKMGNHHYSLIINAARGGVVHERHLLEALEKKQVEAAITDVWEGEPDYNSALRKASFLATPHIAGYSTEAKTRATAMIFRQLCDYTDLKYDGIPESEWTTMEQVSVDAVIPTNLLQALEVIHPIKHYHDNLAKLDELEYSDRARRFSKLRTGMAYRNEFNHICVPVTWVETYPLLKKLDIRVH